MVGKSSSQKSIAVIGGGLAGCETAWALSRAGLRVSLLEMKPERFSPAHKAASLAELVCSNSLRSDDPLTAVGRLKRELEMAGSLVMAQARQTAVPAGKALAVDRQAFSSAVTEAIETNPNIRLQRREIRSLDDPSLAGFDILVLAAGPLASKPLAEDLLGRIGDQGLYFYDSIAPIVSTDSVDIGIAFWGSRYHPEQKDYLNCPLDEDQYHRLRRELLTGARVPLHHFEQAVHFEGCLPVETLAERGELALAYGPLKPVGLVDPRTGKQPFAVVQLRPEDRERQLCNLVGFQTKLTYTEQKRVLRLIPGLESAEFVRLGSMHRNTFVNAPRVLSPALGLRDLPGVYLAGQITGVEGYLESAACGLWLGWHLAGKLGGKEVGLPPQETAIGGLLRYLSTANKNFQPMNVNFGLTPPLRVRAKKSKRKELYAARAEQAWQEWLE
jgi:methylenetetrahydrofolate--tRNA-(uracil-5-)-methyltransferase